jgi:hypothetical protein
MKPPEQPDPLIDEVRSIRRKLDEEAGHDIRKLAENAKKAGDEYRLRQWKTAQAKTQVLSPLPVDSSLPHS